MKKKETVLSADSQKKIENERKRLLNLFEDIPENKKALCEGLIDNAAFLRVQLNELQRDLLENGTRIESISGNGFKSMKDNPSGKLLTGCMAQYNSTIKMLLGLLPEGVDSRKDELLTFLRGDDWRNE